MSTLLPCPFCGGEAAHGMIRYGESPYVDDRCRNQLEYHQVNCVKCCVTVRGLAGLPTKEEATAAWNRRAPGDAQRSLRDEFAGQAVIGFLSGAPIEALTDIMQGIRAGAPLAYGAYAMADAMLAERAKAGQP